MPNNFKGFKTPRLLRFAEMVVFFTEKLQPWKTKLNKLLFYAYFVKYKKTGYSMSGVQYRAIPMGPVPNNFNSIYDYLTNNGDVDIQYTTFTDGGIGEQFKSNLNRKFVAEVFSGNEINILENVADRFKNTSTKEIIERIHKEKAWIENKTEKKITDYNYSFDLNFTLTN